VSGPFRKWVHRHTFVELDGHTTEVLDEVEAELPAPFAQKLVAIGMWLNMPVLFAYRAWKTRRLLERAALATAAQVEHAQ
jgi:ligand-binding SRPBCC domain-containing protein